MSLPDAKTFLKGHPDVPGYNGMVLWDEKKVISAIDRALRDTLEAAIEIVKYAEWCGMGDADYIDRNPVMLKIRALMPKEKSDG